MSPRPVEDVGRSGRRLVRRVTRFDPLARVPRRSRAPGMPPTVGVVGWFGHGNYGDELFAPIDATTPIELRAETTRLIDELRATVLAATAR